MAGRGSLTGMMPYGDANAIVLDMVSLQKNRVKNLLPGDNSLFRKVTLSWTYSLL